MSRKEEYKLQNEQFLEQLRTAEGIKELPAAYFIGYWRKAETVRHHVSTV